MFLFKRLMNNDIIRRRYIHLIKHWGFVHEVYAGPDSAIETGHFIYNNIHSDNRV